MSMGGILWIIVVGFIAGLIARFLAPGPNNPSGFILTTILGIVGAFLATFIGQAIGHYGPGSRRGIHHGHDRRRGGAVHLAPPGRERRDQGVTLRSVDGRHCRLHAVIARSSCDEAIQTVSVEDSGLLRFARNDEFT